MKHLTDPQKEALRFLNEHGGEGVIDAYGRVIAQGERWRTGEAAPVWLRLVTTGHVAGAGAGRLRLTDAGKAVAQSMPPTRRTQHPELQHARGNRPLMVDDNQEDFS